MADINISEFTIGNNTYKYTDSAFQAELNDKVDKVEGYSLISDDDLTKLAGIPSNANHTDVDNALSSSSENPIQNKVIKEAIDELKEYATTTAEGMVKVGDSLQIDDGFLDIKNKVTLSEVRPAGLTDLTIATITDNDGNSYDLTVPTSSNVSITPATITGTKVKIADFVIDGASGELWAPAGGGGGGSSQSVIVPLYENGSSAGDITLDDDYDKYDLLYFTVIKQAGGETTKVITSIETSKISLGDFIQVMGGSAGADWLIYEVNSKTALELDSTPSSVFVESIVGIKIGSVTIDSAIDATSENPVQNKVIKTALDGKVDTNGTDRLMTDAEGVKLAGIAAGAEVNVQANWNESDNTSDAYIANKPTIPSALDDLSDVSTTGASSGQVLTYNGTSWEGATPSAGTITDVQVDNISVVSGGVANISTMTGAGASAAGTKGLVPAPASGDNEKFLRGDGTWAIAGGGSSDLDAIELTQAEYDALTPAQKSDLDKIYFIKDIEDNARFVRSSLFYSTSEAEVGVWTDGKPLYQKTIDFGAMPNSTDKRVNHNISNIDKIVECKGFAFNGTNGFPLMMSNDTLAGQATLWATTSDIAVWAGNNRSEYSLVVTLYYTKTTDVAGSGKYAELGAPAVHYDSNEKVIGTWFGETLYEKTLDLGSSITFNPNVWTTISGIIMPGCVCKKAEAIDYDGTYSNTFPIAFSINKQTGQLDLNQFRSTTIAVRWITIQYTKTTTS